MDRIQLRRDSSARWAEINPILLEGEVGYEIDTRLRKIGDGVNRWNDLEYLRAEGISQETGNSQNITISQDAITRELSELGSELDDINTNLFGISENTTPIDIQQGKSTKILTLDLKEDLKYTFKFNFEMVGGECYIYLKDSEGADIVYISTINTTTTTIEKKISKKGNKGAYIQISNFGITVKGELVVVAEKDENIDGRINVLSEEVETLSGEVDKLQSDSIIKDTIEFDSSTFKYPRLYLNTKGEPIGTASSSAVTDFIEIAGATSNITVRGRNTGGIVATLAFYDENKNFISAIATQKEVVTIDEIPGNAVYIRATGHNDGEDYIAFLLERTIADKFKGLDNSVNELENKINLLDEIPNKVQLLSSTIYKRDTIEFDSTTFEYPKLYLNVEGEQIATSSSSAVTDFLDITNAISITARGRNLGGIVATLAFYDKNKTFISAVPSKEEVIEVTEIPNNAVFIRATGHNDGNDYIIINKEYAITDYLLTETEKLNTVINKPKCSDILLTGASFAYSGNQWPKILGEMLKVSVLNKAVSGTSILDTARKMYNNTLYTADEMEKFGILLIMHVHDVDVCTTSGNKGLMDNYNDYENATYFPTEYSSDRPANMSYEQAYDYVLKKYAAECYAMKDDASSKWYGQKMGKPCIVFCATHWHDARVIFNESIRRLQDKWGFHLIEIDRNIGFSKNQVHPVTMQQTSMLYAVDTETIDGVTYGWHPDRTLKNGEYPVIQTRIARLIADKITNL